VDKPETPQQKEEETRSQLVSRNSIMKSKSIQNPRTANLRESSRQDTFGSISQQVMAFQNFSNLSTKQQI
jgi:hypothetical protein